MRLTPVKRLSAASASTTVQHEPDGDPRNTYSDDHQYSVAIQLGLRPPAQAADQMLT